MANTEIAVPTPVHPVTPPRRVPKPRTAADRKARLQQIFANLDQLFPAATCALHHRNAWELLVATILSAQCTDERVNKVTPGLFTKYPKIQDFASVSQDELAQDIRSTGFFNNKARSVIGAARKILADFEGEVPRSMLELLQVPGAARKTANVVLGTAYDVAAGVVVDTHVQRISNRLDLTKQTDPVKLNRISSKSFPRIAGFCSPTRSSTSEGRFVLRESQDARRVPSTLCVTPKIKPWHELPLLSRRGWRPSSTIALIANERGEIVGMGRGGPCNHVSSSEARARFLSVLGACLAEAIRGVDFGQAAPHFAAACLGFSGGAEDKVGYSQNLSRPIA